jgi:hypothetical protein
MERKDGWLLNEDGTYLMTTGIGGEYTDTPMTVKDLRKFLEGIPDDVVLKVGTMVNWSFASSEPTFIQYNKEKNKLSIYTDAPGA